MKSSYERLYGLWTFSGIGCTADWAFCLSDACADWDMYDGGRDVGFQL